MTPAARRALRLAFVAVAALCVAGYGGAAAYVKLNETALIFPREVAPNGLPAPADSLHLPYHEVTFRTADSVTLSTWVIPASHADSSGMWVLLCHGQTGNLATTTRPEYYANLRTLGVNIMAFDWRGFGASGGTPSEEGLYRDATAAYEYLRNVEHVAPDHIIIFGHSLGTAPAIELATRVPAAALIVEGAPASVRQRGQEVYPWLPLKLISNIEFNSLGRIGQVSMPKLFLHSRDDKRIPIAHGRALFDAAHEPKRFVETGGEHHNVFLRDSATYFGAYRQFMQELPHGYPDEESRTHQDRPPRTRT